MKYRTLEAIARERRQKKVPYAALMKKRVRNVLLVSSPYDSFTFEEDGSLTELLFSEYVELHLRYAPEISRVSTAEEALESLSRGKYDLVISMLRVGDMDIAEFGRQVAKLVPDLPVVLLTYHTRELTLLQDLGELPGIDRVFVWLGDVRLFLAIIKYIEDRLNFVDDAVTAGVQSILLVEDSPRFYSSYLPLAYTELVRQTQELMTDGLNRMDKLVRMRARPKILLATSFEEGAELFLANRDHVAGVILDTRFPHNGRADPRAGIDFAKMVIEKAPDRPVLMQSSNPQNEVYARALGVPFLDKHAPNLLGNLREFMRDHMGFGEFVFRLSNGEEIGRATNLRNLAGMMAKIPADSLRFHAGRNDFSTWLMARTEFDLAELLRPRQESEFGDIEEMRAYLVGELEAHSIRSRAGVVADFSSGTFNPTTGFVRIGSGSLGGKGRGLAFMHKLLERYRIAEDSDVKIFIPPTAVLATGIFDEFMRNNNLDKLVFSEATDREIAAAFLEAHLPDEAMDNIETFLTRADYPLAVRSSSLLEDASYQPFAGLYKTYMLPNNHENFEIRLNQLTRAVKLVYASTYYADAKSYIESTPNRLEEEKMAVVIQEIVGKRRGDHIYPDIAGVVRSYDFYPMEGMNAEEGVAMVVLGLGKAVVDGGQAMRFSPAEPRRLYQFSTPEEALNNAQKQFIALDMSNRNPTIDLDTEDPNLVTLDLDIAERDGILASVGSVYSPENGVIYDGTSRPGVRLVTMAGVLKGDVFPLATTLERLLEIGKAGFSSQVEIEFAANICSATDNKKEFGFLQIRPVVVGTSGREVNFDELNEEEIICLSRQALGNGIIDGVCDIVYVPMMSFERSKTLEIAAEIGTITRKLKAEKRPFLLIGPGRWGSADRWLGIPVTWSQIAGVRCIVETDLEDIRVTPSQGTHFFQNITSFGIGYFTLNFNNHGGFLDSQWLDAETPQTHTPHVKLLRFEEPLNIVTNAKQGQGVVMKPGYVICPPRDNRDSREP